MTDNEIFEAVKQRFTDPKVMDLLRNGLADPEEMEVVKRALRYGDAAMTIPSLRSILYKVFDRLLNVVKDDSTTRQMVKQDLRQLQKGDSDMSEDLNTANVAKAVAHDCAKHVVHETWGKGQCIAGEHTLLEDGTVTHYDVMFEHGIEQDVPVADLTVVVSESHMHASKKKKAAMEEEVVTPAGGEDTSKASKKGKPEMPLERLKAIMEKKKSKAYIAMLKSQGKMEEEAEQVDEAKESSDHEKLADKLYGHQGTTRTGEPTYFEGPMKHSDQHSTDKARLDKHVPAAKEPGSHVFRISGAKGLVVHHKKGITALSGKNEVHHFEHGEEGHKKLQAHISKKFGMPHDDENREVEAGAWKMSKRHKAEMQKHYDDVKAYVANLKSQGKMEEEVEQVDEAEYVPTQRSNFIGKHHLKRDHSDELGSRYVFSTDPAKMKKSYSTERGQKNAANRNVPNLKATIKSSLGKHPKPNLPEEAELDEKKLTSAEMKKREEVAKAIKRDQPGMPMGKKMAIATATAKKVAEAKAHTVPKTPKEKSLAALAAPHDKITHADVMVGRGVGKKKTMKEFVEQLAESLAPKGE